MCNKLTKLSVTMRYTFFGIFHDTSLWILPKTHDPSLCDTPDKLVNIKLLFIKKGQEKILGENQNCHFYAEIVNFGLILTHLIGEGGKCPIPLACGTATD